MHSDASVQGWIKLFLLTLSVYFHRHVTVLIPHFYSRALFYPLRHFSTHVNIVVHIHRFSLIMMLLHEIYKYDPQAANETQATHLVRIMLDQPDDVFLMTKPQQLGYLRITCISLLSKHHKILSFVIRGDWKLQTRFLRYMFIRLCLRELGS